MQHRNTTVLLALLIGIGAIAFNSVEASGQTIVELRVDGDDGLADPTGSPPGESWSDAYKYLQDALDRADFLIDDEQADEVEIWVKGETTNPYRPDQSAANQSGTNSTSATFEMLENVSILGGFDGTESAASERDPEQSETVLSGVLTSNQALHVVSVLEVVDSSAVLDGFTISGGDADESPFTENGGGILVQPGATGATPLFRNCLIRDNEGRDGGGVACQVGGDAIFVECTFEDNAAPNGDGGALYAATAQPTLINCRFIDNTALDRGGAVAVVTAEEVVIVNCLFVGNQATASNSRGGAISNFKGALLMTNCTLTENAADEGGAFHQNDLGGPMAFIRNSIL